MEAHNVTSFRYGKSKIQVLECIVPAGATGGVKDFRIDLDVDYKYCTGITIGTKKMIFSGLANIISFLNENGTFVNPTIYNVFDKTLNIIDKSEIFWNCFIPAKGKRLTIRLNYLPAPMVIDPNKFFVLLRLENEPAIPEFEYNLQQKAINITATGIDPYDQTDNIYFDNTYDECVGIQSVNLTAAVGGTTLPSSYYKSSILDGNKILLNDCNDMFLESSVNVGMNRGFFPLDFNCHNKTITIRTHIDWYNASLGFPVPGTFDLHKYLVFLVRKPFDRKY